MVELVTIDRLLPKALVGPLIGTPKLGNLYCNTSIIWTAILNTINSLSKLEDSTMLWRLLYQIAKVFCKYNNNPE